MQQPETHLHPKAQALLAEIVAESGCRYVIETHADHLINRFSICVRRGELAAEDVAIVWFEKRDGQVVLHEMSFDEQGNLLNAPNNYREFFERETEAFLGF